MTGQELIEAIKNCIEKSGKDRPTVYIDGYSEEMDEGDLYDIEEVSVDDDGDLLISLW